MTKNFYLKHEMKVPVSVSAPKIQRVHMPNKKLPGMTLFKTYDSI